MLITTTSSRSNRRIFLHRDTGSPHDGLMAHISSLGQIGRLDFERCAVAGEILFAVEGDATPVSQQDEEARIGTLAYAIKKLGDTGDAAEFIRCLNAICGDGDARCRQTTASHYLNEIALRGTSVVLKEMTLLAMQLAGLNSTVETVETDELNASFEREAELVSRGESDPQDIRSFYYQEVDAISRKIRGRRKGASFIHDNWTEWLNDLEAGGASIQELDDAFTYLEAMDQYDEGGAITIMSSHERTVACGRVDPEYTAEDMPERAQHLAIQLRRDYANGVGIDEIWDEINSQIDVTFPMSGRKENGARFYSHANRELRQLSREVLDAILDECQQDFHLTALRINRSYRQFHKAIRSANNTLIVGEVMQRAYEARQTGMLALKHLVALKTAAALQRERLQSARLSRTATKLIDEVNAASCSRLRYLAWAFYGNNQPDHPLHSLTQQEINRVWEALKTRKATLTTAHGKAA